MRSRTLTIIAHACHNLDYVRALQQRDADIGAASPQPLLTERQNVFNKKLAKRLSEDGISTSVKVLPDGGIHVTIGKEHEHEED